MIEEWFKLKSWLEDKVKISIDDSRNYSSYPAFDSVRRKIKELENDYDCKSLAEAGYF